MEVLRGSFMQDGNKIELVFNADDRRPYRIGTRWIWLCSFESILDACDAFEVLELTSAPPTPTLGRAIRSEIVRTPRVLSSRRPAAGRVVYLLDSVEKRLSGLRPTRCGSKGAVERWVPR